MIASERGENYGNQCARPLWRERRAKPPQQRASPIAKQELATDSKDRSTSSNQKRDDALKYSFRHDSPAKPCCLKPPRLRAVLSKLGIRIGDKVDPTPHVRDRAHRTERRKTASRRRLNILVGQVWITLEPIPIFLDRCLSGMSERTREASGKAKGLVRPKTRGARPRSHGSSGQHHKPSMIG